MTHLGKTDILQLLKSRIKDAQFEHTLFNQLYNHLKNEEETLGIDIDPDHALRVKEAKNHALARCADASACVFNLSTMERVLEYGAPSPWVPDKTVSSGTMDDEIRHRTKR